MFTKKTKQRVSLIEFISNVPYKTIIIYINKFIFLSLRLLIVCNLKIDMHIPTCIHRHIIVFIVCTNCIYFKERKKNVAIRMLLYTGKKITRK